MNLYCINEFKDSFEKLLSKKSYHSLQDDLIKYLFSEDSNELKPVKELLSGTRLNNSEETPYIKKRISGSGGYRLYFLVLIRKSNLYLMYVHPKTGSIGAKNITDKSKAHLYKKVLTDIKSKSLFKISLDTINRKLNFEEVKK